ncbi:MAG: hypothetical protein PWP04_1803 [Candidatus Atribacteria bacterium]|nr:hypothetical protein [Candidatus Atribacteria bacterium]
MDWDAALRLRKFSPGGFYFFGGLQGGGKSYSFSRFALTFGRGLFTIQVTVRYHKLKLLTLQMKVESF